MLRTVVPQGADPQSGDSYFVEMLSWQGVRYKSELRRELEWRLFSIGKASLDVRGTRNPSNRKRIPLAAASTTRALPRWRLAQSWPRRRHPLVVPR